MTTSFITTVFNEQETIRIFLDSVFSQSIVPDEIIIVDANSTDNTAHIISEYFKKYDYLSTHLLKKSGNRSVGRNTAIKHAKHEIILCSDAGCVLDKDWVRNLLDKFHKKDIGVVSGYYKPITPTIFTKCLATYTCVMPDTIDKDNFLPSSRSVAFRKSAWEMAGGYPENLDTCEDLIFDKRLKSAGINFCFSKTALVFWPQRKNLFQAFNQFFSYAQGDGKAFYIRPQTPFLFLRYFAAIVLFSLYVSQPLLEVYIFVSLAIVYSLWSIGKNYRYVNHPKALIYLPLLQFTADIAVLWGMTTGLLEFVMSKAKQITLQ